MFLFQDELLSRKKKEKKKRTGGKNVDEGKLGGDKNERWECRKNVFVVDSLLLLKRIVLGLQRT